jgi:hypothetical protein
MRTIYEHVSTDGRTMTAQTRTEPDEPMLRISLDAPGERAVSHEFDAEDHAITVLLTALTPLAPHAAQPIAEPDPEAVQLPYPPPQMEDAEDNRE